MKGNKLAQKNRRRNRRLLLLDLLLLAVLVFFMGRSLILRDFVLIGDSYMNVEQGSEFTDPGTGCSFAHAEGSVDTDTVGEYVITYSLLDKELKRTVYVFRKPDDSIRLGLRGSAVQMVRQYDPYIENGAFAVRHTKDDAGERIPDTDIQIGGEVDTSRPGDYTVTYELVRGDQSYSAVRTVRVISAEEFGKEAESVPVLMYHWVYTADSPPANLTSNWILDTDFDAQLKYLKDNEFYYPGWAEFRAWLDGDIAITDHSVMLTFNDGKKEFFVNGKPLLEKYEIPATVFLTCSEKNKGAEKTVKYASTFLDFESQSFDLHRAGSISGYRGIMAEKTAEEIQKDLETSCDIVGRNEAFAYPYGEYPDKGVEAVEKTGFRVAFTTQFGRAYIGQDPFRLPRIRINGDEGLDLFIESVNK